MRCIFIVLVFYGSKPPFESKFKGRRKQQLVRLETVIRGNRPRNKCQDIIGIRGVMAIHLQGVNVVNIRRVIVFRNTLPRLACRPLGIAHSRPLHLAARSLDGHGIHSAFPIRLSGESQLREALPAQTDDTRST